MIVRLEHRPEGGPPTGGVGAAPSPRLRTRKCGAKRRHGETTFFRFRFQMSSGAPAATDRPEGGPPTGDVGAAPRRDPRTRKCGAKRRHGETTFFRFRFQMSSGAPAATNRPEGGPPTINRLAATDRPEGGPPTINRPAATDRPEGGPPTGGVGAAPPPRFPHREVRFQMSSGASLRQIGPRAGLPQ